MKNPTRPTISIYKKMDGIDDYFVTEVVIPVTQSYLNPNSIGQYFEYNIPMPADVMRIRYIDYQGGSQWYPMDKFPMSMKDYAPSSPMYRWRNGNLNVIGGGMGAQLSSIRVGYYPAPITFNLPGPSINIGSTLTQAQQTSLVSPVFTNTYAPGGNLNNAQGTVGRVVYYNGTAIVAEDEDLLTVTTLYTGAGITQVKYYQGYVFYLQAGAIYKFQSNLTSVGTPTLVVTPGVAPTEFAILTPTVINTPANYNPPYLLWASDNSTYSTIYTTAGSVVSTTAQGYRDFFACQGYFFGVTTAGALYKFAGTTFLQASGVQIPYTSLIQDAWSDGTYIYLTVPYTTALRKITLNTALTAVLTDVVLSNDININTVWGVDNGMATYQQMDLTWTSNSLAEDTGITYPNNIVPELIAFQCALDFIAKQHGDASQVNTRYTSLFQRYKDSLRRDDYQVERIKNDYPQTNFNFFR